MPATRTTMRAGRIIENSSMWRKPARVVASPVTPKSFPASPIFFSMSLMLKIFE